MIDQQTAEELLQVIGKRLRVMTVEEAAATARSELSERETYYVVVPAVDDWTPLVHAAYSAAGLERIVVGVTRLLRRDPDAQEAAE